MTNVYDPGIKIRTADGWRDFSQPGDWTPPDPDPDPDPPDPEDWPDVFASRDVDGQILAWYVANTGHNPGLVYSTLPSGTWTVNSTWLTNNEDDDHVYQEGGRWVVERFVVPGMIRVQADNVTFRHINQDGSGGALYGVQSRAADGPATGTIFEYCTFAGNSGNENGAGLNFPANTDADQVIFRYCDMSGYRAGFYMFRGVTVEYSYAHNLYFSPESHNTGASIRGGNCRLYRTLITDGNSASLSFYPEFGPYTNVLAEENIFRLFPSDTGPEVILASGRDYSDPEPGDTRRLIGNLFYRGGDLDIAVNGHVSTSDDLPSGLGVTDRNLCYSTDSEGRFAWDGVEWVSVGSSLSGGGLGGYLAGFTEVSGNIDRAGNPVP